jgi:hypothetical protein
LLAVASLTCVVLIRSGTGEALTFLALSSILLLAQHIYLEWAFKRDFEKISKEFGERLKKLREERAGRIG